MAIKIPLELKRRLVEEFKFIERKMREEKDVRRKLYYFSATYGEVFRILNMAYDPQLVFMHFVLNGAYATMDGLLTRIEQGVERVIRFPENYFEKLVEMVGKLTELIENDKDTYEILQKIAVLTYTITGNGYYLYQKGVLKI